MPPAAVRDGEFGVVDVAQLFQGEVDRRNGWRLAEETPAPPVEQLEASAVYRRAQLRSWRRSPQRKFVAPVGRRDGL